MVPVAKPGTTHTQIEKKENLCLSFVLSMDVSPRYKPVIALGSRTQICIPKKVFAKDRFNTNPNAYYPQLVFI